MIRKGFHIAVVICATAAANPAWAANTELEGVHVSATSSGTQVTLDLTGLTTEKLFTLDHPDRAVIDLGHTHLAGGLRLPAGAGVVSGFRVGNQPGGTLRVVMQLKSMTATRSAWVQTPNSATRQLMITLGAATAAPAMAYASPTASVAAAPTVTAPAAPAAAPVSA